MSGPPALPAPRDESTGYTIAMVCLGNICRSPMAEVVLTAKLASAKLANSVVVTSSGTGDWHMGHPMDDRAAATLAAAGYDPSRHRAQRFSRQHLDASDLVLAMDRSNLQSIELTAGEAAAEHERVRLFRDFDPEASADTDLDDPFYGDLQGFSATLRIVERTADELVVLLQRMRERPPA